MCKEGDGASPETRQGLRPLSLLCNKMGQVEERRNMVKKYKNKTNLFIGLGILTMLATNPMMSEVGQSVGFLMAATGYILVIVGCCYYAKGKGYHGALGLFGLASIIGLLVLICLPDRAKENH